MGQRVITRQEFAQLYSEKYMQLYYLAYDFLGDEEQSRDVVGDVFAAVWKNRERANPDTLPSYLYISVRNRSLDLLRKRTKQTAFEREFACVLEQMDIDEWEARDDRIRQLQHELRQMPERTQFVLKERFFNDRTNQEVATQLGLTEAGIKKLIGRAFAHLRQKLK